MNPNDLWAKKRPFPDKGDDEKNNVCLAVGQALSAWELFESSCTCSIFAMIMAPGNYSHAARRAYGTIVSFKGRAEMLGEVAEIYFASEGEKYKEGLATAMKLAGRAAAVRNNIAHGLAMPFSTVKSYEQKQGWVLIPSWYSTNKRDLDDNPSYIYTSKEINDFTLGFESLGSHFRDFFSHLQVTNMWARKSREHR
ncbi:MAG: hypothetical protein ACRYFU_04465 [Janthinobacterium lividum]